MTIKKESMNLVFPWIEVLKCKAQQIDFLSIFIFKE